MKTLYMMIGIPGSGKSTWLKTYADNGVIISRDEVRFSMVREDEPYFSREKEVFESFIEDMKYKKKLKDDFLKKSEQEAE